jgi:hypothetical protein
LRREQPQPQTRSRISIAPKALPCVRTGAGTVVATAAVEAVTGPAGDATADAAAIGTVAVAAEGEGANRRPQYLNEFLSPGR